MKKILVLLCCPTFLATLAFGYDWSDTDFNIILQDDYMDGIDYIENYENMYIPTHNRIARDTESAKQTLNSNTTASTTTTSTAYSTTTTPNPTSTTTEKSTNCRTPPRPTQNSSAGNNRFQRTCCGDRDDLKMHGDALKEIRRECFAEIRRNRAAKAVDSEPFDMFNCRKVGKSKDDLVCAMECVARKKNLIDSAGYISRQNTTNFVKNELVNAEWQKKIIDNVLEKCLKDAENHTEYSVSTSSANSSSASNVSVTSTNISSISLKNDTDVVNERCNPSTLKFSHCIWREMQLSCPSDMIRETRQCQRLRERLQKKEYPDFESKNGNQRNRNQNQNNKGHRKSN